MLRGRVGIHGRELQAQGFNRTACVPELERQDRIMGVADYTDVIETGNDFAEQLDQLAAEIKG